MRHIIGVCKRERRRLSRTSNLRASRTVVYSHSKVKSSAIVLFLIVLCASALLGQGPLDARLAVLDPIINDAIAAQQIPGAVVIVGHNGQIVYRKAYGSRAIVPRREPMMLDTIFDCASLTKVVVTTTAVMQLWEQGKFRTTDPVVEVSAGVCAERQAGHHDSRVTGALFRPAKGSRPGEEVGGERHGLSDGV